MKKLNPRQSTYCWFFLLLGAVLSTLTPNVSNASGWKISTIDSIESMGPKSNSIAIDSNNKIHISYYDPLPGDLKYATNASGSWQTVTRIYRDSPLQIGSDNKW